MSRSLDSLKGGNVGKSIGDYVFVAITGDTERVWTICHVTLHNLLFHSDLFVWLCSCISDILGCSMEYDGSSAHRHERQYS